MHGDILFINKNHISAAKSIYETHLKKKPLKKFIVAVSGEVSTGKSEISQLLARMLSKDNKRTKVINMDSFYKVPPKDRQAWRKKNGLDKIGPQEYDWDRINQTIKAFKQGEEATIPYADVITKQLDLLTTSFQDIDILIVNGLYAVALEESNLNIIIELDYHDSLKQQIRSENETLDEWRMKELEQEHKMVLSLKKKGHYFVDSDTSLEFFHL